MLPIGPIVITRAATNAMAPDGTSLLTVNPIGIPVDSGSAALSAPCSTNVNVRVRSRVNNSGPSVQYSRRLSPDQWMDMPSLLDTRATGN